MKFSIPQAQDLGSGLVVFLVALPLCMGISLASDAPLETGLIAGIVGGIVTGIFSGSRLGVSGPAAGLATIVAAAIASAGSYERFLVAGMLAGLFQLVFGFLRLGVLKSYIPKPVITGMLAGIGVLLLYKQLPYALGPTFAYAHFSGFHFPTIAMAVGSIALLSAYAFWSKIPYLGKLPIHLPVAVAAGLVILLAADTYWANAIKVPVLPEGNFTHWFRTPDFSALSDPQIWTLGLSLAIVASIESLLSLEAADNLANDGSQAPANQELFAQGLGNFTSSMLGGLPLTQVIVRTTANHSAGAKTKWSAVFHGIFLAVFLLFFPQLTAYMPYPFLAAILLLTGFKLAHPKIWVEHWKKSKVLFLTFALTVIGVVFIDLLKGVVLGLALSFLLPLFDLLRHPFYVEETADSIILKPKGNYYLIHEIAFKRLQKRTTKRVILQMPDDQKTQHTFWFKS